MPDSNGGSNLFTRFDATFATGGGRAAWIQRIQDGFDRWAELTGIQFTRVIVANDADDGAPWGADAAPGLRGDIRIRAAFIDGPWSPTPPSGGALAFAQMPHQPNPGEITFDQDEDWLGEPWLPGFGFNRTIHHEIGHAIGLDHVCPNDQSKLMEQFANTPFYGAQHDDLRGAQALYGDPLEPNDGLSEAVPLNLPLFSQVNLGAIDSQFGPGAIQSGRLSIDAPDDIDVFSIVSTVPVLMQLQLSPIGLVYSDDDCSGTPNLTNSDRIVDLKVELLDRTGTLITEVTTAFGNEASFNRQLPIVNLPYFVRVSPANPGFSEPQTYDLTLFLSPGDPCGGGPCDDGIARNGVETCQQGACVVSYPGGDCNGNYIDDAYDIAEGTSADCDGNFVPDECQPDCNLDGVPDVCDLSPCEPDCNNNGIPDVQDIASGTSLDVNYNDVPDSCEGPDITVPSNNNPDLATALLAANNGQTIRLLPGMHTGAGFRDLDVTDKTVQIISTQGPYRTTIDLQGMGRFMTLLKTYYNRNKTRIEGITFTNGMGNNGGVITCWGADVKVNRCIFAGNTATGGGGAIHLRGGSSSLTGPVDARIDSCIFYENVASNGGAIICEEDIYPVVLNSTFVGNELLFPSGHGAALANVGLQDGLSLVNCIVWDNVPSTKQLGITSGTVRYCDLPAVDLATWSGAGNFSATPGFQNQAARNFHLSASSPCRNMGDPNYFPSVHVSGDVDGALRIQEFVVDVGADEF